LRVNPNTVARAYRELEHESLVEKRRTTGTFVAELPKRLGIAQRRKLIAPEIDKLLILARQLGIPLSELTGLLEKRDHELEPKEARS
jgi:GntR family transcriptional regulator